MAEDFSLGSIEVALSPLERFEKYLQSRYMRMTQQRRLFGNTINWLSGYLLRQGPVLEANHPGLVRKAKPLCRFYEREMASYALLRGIEYIYEECPHARGAKSIYYKELLNRLEADRPGAKLSFYLSFLQAKKNGLTIIKIGIRNPANVRGFLNERLAPVFGRS